MKLFQKGLALCLGVLLTLSLAACGGKSQTETPASVSYTHLTLPTTSRV